MDPKSARSIALAALMFAVAIAIGLVFGDGLPDAIGIAILAGLLCLLVARRRP